jgi:hypothetical protein
MIFVNIAIQFGALRGLKPPARAIYGFFNRYSHLLEPHVSRGKQTPTHLSNLEFFRDPPLVGWQNTHRRVTPLEVTQ